MQVSCDPILFFDELVLERTMTLDDWFAMARDLGLDGTEIQHNCLDSYEPAALADLRRRLDRYGLAVSQFIGAPDFSHPDPDVRAAEVETTCRHVDVAVALEAPCIRVTAGQAHPEVSREDGIAYVVDALRETLDYADKRGVWLAYENHYKDYFWDQPDFSQPHEVFLEIVGRLVDTPLKINFDCSNSIMLGKDPAELLPEVVDRVVHVHCNDRATYHEYTHTVVGTGLADVPKLLGMLKRAGYDGWLSIEYNGNEGVSGLKQSIEFVRMTWPEV